MVYSLTPIFSAKTELPISAKHSSFCCLVLNTIEPLQLFKVGQFKLCHQDPKNYTCPTRGISAKTCQSVGLPPSRFPLPYSLHGQEKGKGELRNYAQEETVRKEKVKILNNGNHVHSQDRDVQAIERAKEQAHEAKEKAIEYAHKTKEKTKETAESAAEKAKETAQSPKEKAKEYTQETKEKAKEGTEKSSQTAYELTEKTKEKAHDVKEKTEEIAGSVASKASETVQTIGEKAKQTVQGAEDGRRCCEIEEACPKSRG
ncbi:late embryogenesis abundant protein 76-like [Durio zibethinus]|uniref:Late embryogenesis abundant protein 76-like n=1 Tax=Durio zibethinus TaxID=66656 RepID=A0A6P5X5N5_DURZI|nr:late embryogenesis abundant protein 76-like [Durio zibethinus]